MRHRLAVAFAAAACLFAASPARAGLYSDELAKCLVRSTTPQDRAALVRWMFIALSNHPAVKSVASVTKAQAEDANRTTGELFMRLLTTACKDDTQRALQYEGTGAISSGFQVLGQVAGRELMGSPDVAASFAGLEKYLDASRIQALVKNAASAGR